MNNSSSSTKVTKKRSRVVEIKEEMDHNLKKFQDEYNYEQSSPINYDRIKKMNYIVLIMFAEHIIRGNLLFDSFIGIER